MPGNYSLVAILAVENGPVHVTGAVMIHIKMWADTIVENKAHRDCEKTAAAVYYGTARCELARVARKRCLRSECCHFLGCLGVLGCLEVGCVGVMGC